MPLSTLDDPDLQAAAAEMAREALRRGRRFTFTALGASMRPYLYPGDRVTVAPCAGRLRPGDVILLDVGDLGLVHRIICALPGRVCVKGDALPYIDGWFPPARILGRVIHVERGGRRVRPGGLDAVVISALGGWARQIRRAFS